MFAKVVARGLLVAVIASSAIQAQAIVNIDLVSVGDKGNANDTTGYGGVTYRYLMGKYEVTNLQYCEFLNAKAAIDTYALYSTGMSSDMRGGIKRSGSSGSYTYTVKSGYENMPVVYVCWYDCIRFANWLQNGQGSGNTESGTYTITDGGANSGTVEIPDALTRANWATANSHWVLPSEDEWYKAAYYQPTSKGGDTDDYWTYPTRTNNEPYSDQPPGSDAPVQANTANFNMDDGVTNGYNDGFAVTASTDLNVSSNYLTNVGAYTLSSSYYGTFDQGGNVWEWNEAVVNGVLRGFRGGDWSNHSVGMRAVTGGGDDPWGENVGLGFRVGFVPEPSSIILLASAGLLAYILRRMHIV